MFHIAVPSGAVERSYMFPFESPEQALEQLWDRVRDVTAPGRLAELERHIAEQGDYVVAQVARRLGVAVPVLDPQVQHRRWVRSRWTPYLTVRIPNFSWLMALPVVVALLAVVLRSSVPWQMAIAAAGLSLLPAAYAFTAARSVRSVEGFTDGYLIPSPQLLARAEGLPAEVSDTACVLVGSRPLTLRCLPWTARTVQRLRRRDEAFVVALAWLCEHDPSAVGELLTGPARKVVPAVMAAALAGASRVAAPAAVA